MRNSETSKPGRLDLLIATSGRNSECDQKLAYRDVTATDHAGKEIEMPGYCPIGFDPRSRG
jgi:hypothetical protein